MSEQKKSVNESRRKFLETTSKAAVVAPAAGLLLAVNSSKKVAADSGNPGETPTTPPQI